MLAPNLYSDVSNQYRGADDLINQSAEFPNYYTYSLWDTFRAVHPLFTIIQQERIAGLVNGMMAHYKETGLLPVWSVWGNETNTMISYHSIPVIVDAYFKGLLNEELLNRQYLLHDDIMEGGILEFNMTNRPVR